MFAYLQRRARSFAAAFAGFRVLAEESHCRIHALAAVAIGGVLFVPRILAL